MVERKNPPRLVLLAAVLLVLPVCGTGKIQPAVTEKFTPHGPAILWANPVDLESRDLLNGPGGVADVPHGTFTFVKEDLHGTNPKIVVRDEDGVKWIVKFGIEARPETAASRIVWSIGYFANEDYFVDRLMVQGMPEHLHRGQNLAEPDGSVRNVRLKREPDNQKKIGTWHWRRDAFTGTREWNGLRTLMAVINNWDLKDENNSVFEDKKSGESIFITRDIGATFGTNGLSWSKDRSKGDVATYEKSKFITHKSGAQVDFATPAAPDLLTAPNVEQYEMRRGLEWIGKDIPIADARWIGSLLKQLSHQQLVDAFRAGHFPPKEVESYVKVIERRIQELAVL